MAEQPFVKWKSLLVGRSFVRSFVVQVKKEIHENASNGKGGEAEVHMRAAAARRLIYLRQNSENILQIVMLAPTLVKPMIRTGHPPLENHFRFRESQMS
jgi:hypothetical protein